MSTQVKNSAYKGAVCLVLYNKIVYITYTKSPYIVHQKTGQKSLKKFLKKLKKSVDKAKVMWYYNRAPLREGAFRVPERARTNLEN